MWPISFEYICINLYMLRFICIRTPAFPKPRYNKCFNKNRYVQDSAYEAC